MRGFQLCSSHASVPADYHRSAQLPWPASMEGAIAILNKFIDPVPGKKKKKNCILIHVHQISGQEDLSDRTSYHRLFAPLWPCSLGISDSCQYTTFAEDFKNHKSQKTGQFWGFFAFKSYLLLSFNSSRLCTRGLILSCPIVVFILHFSRLFTCVQGNGATAMTSCCRCASVHLRVFAPWTWS